MKVEVSSFHFKAREELNEFAIEKVTKLGRFDPNIINSKVFLKLENQHTKVNDNDKVAELIMHSPGHELFASAKSDSFEKSISMACEKIENQIRHYH